MKLSGITPEIMARKCMTDIEGTRDRETGISV
jgi:hypothetical protein